MQSKKNLFVTGLLLLCFTLYLRTFEGFVVLPVGGLIFGGAHFGNFAVASQMNNNYSRNSKIKFEKFYGI